PMACWVRAGLLATVGVGTVTMLSGYHFWCLVTVMLALSLSYNVRTFLIVATIVIVFVMTSPFVAPRNYQANVVEVLDFYERGVLDESAVVAEDYSGGELPTTTEVKKRWIEWQPALNMLRDSPVFGVGTGGYQLHIGGNYGMLPNFKKIEPDTNCGWLVIAASMGLCGFIAWATLLYSQYRSAMAQATGAASMYLRTLSLGLGGSILGLFLAMIFSHVLVRGLSITVILILALVSAIEAFSYERKDAALPPDDTTKAAA
ncbi:MAG: hypothetical protein ACUVX8_11700, partial [Candidatus Zipacnadales bacterium]